MREGAPIVIVNNLNECATEWVETNKTCFVYDLACGIKALTCRWDFNAFTHISALPSHPECDWMRKLEQIQTGSY